MREAFKIVVGKKGENLRLSVDSNPKEFSETMGYSSRSFSDSKAFFEFFSQKWIVELRNTLKKVLTKDRAIFEIGAGEGEHSLPLFLDGFKISASDISESAFVQTKKLFPNFPVFQFDIFSPSTISEKYDDILISGMDFYFNQQQVHKIFSNVRLLLKPRGRLIFTLRYQDNPVTFLIDNYPVPFEKNLRNFLYFCFGKENFAALKKHGYRRSRKEIIHLHAPLDFHWGQLFKVVLEWSSHGFILTASPRFFSSSRNWTRNYIGLKTLPSSNLKHNEKMSTLEI